MGIDVLKRIVSPGFGQTNKGKMIHFFASSPYVLPARCWWVLQWCPNLLHQEIAVGYQSNSSHCYLYSFGGLTTLFLYSSNSILSPEFGCFLFHIWVTLPAFDLDKASLSSLGYIQAIVGVFISILWFDITLPVFRVTCLELTTLQLSFNSSTNCTFCFSFKL